MTTLEVTDADSGPRAFGSFLSRLRAMLLDAVCLTTVFMGIFVLLAITADVPGSGRLGVGAIVLLALLYEPVSVACYGGTIGHRRCNLRVMDERTRENPTFPRAMLRFILKSIFGILSFTTMALTRRHQALHDSLTGTTVQIRDLTLANPEHVRWERPPLDAPGLPSKPRRIAVILGYMIGTFITMSVGLALLLSEGCMVYEQCSPTEELASQVLGLAWMAGSVYSIIAGWRGKLWGARLTAASPAV